MSKPAPLLPMTDAIYKTLLEALDELDDACKPDAQSIAARAWVHDLARYGYARSRTTQLTRREKATGAPHAK